MYQSTHLHSSGLHLPLEERFAQADESKPGIEISTGVLCGQDAVATCSNFKTCGTYMSSKCASKSPKSYYIEIECDSMNRIELY